jgi:hypothetical protein
MAEWSVNTLVTEDEQLLKELHKEIFLDHKRETKELLESHWKALNPIGRISGSSQYTCR